MIVVFLLCILRFLLEPTRVFYFQRAITAIQMLVVIEKQIF